MDEAEHKARVAEVIDAAIGRWNDLPVIVQCTHSTPTAGVVAASDLIHLGLIGKWRSDDSAA